VAEGVGDEAGFDPFAALFEVFEELELVHGLLRCGTSGEGTLGKRKGAACGPRLDFPEFLLSTSSIAI